MPLVAPGRRTLVLLLALGAAATLVLSAVTTTSEALYLDVAGTVSAWPAWTHAAVEAVSEGGLVVLAVVLAVVAWRARAGRGAAVVAGAAVVLAYGLSEALKLAAEQERPCRALPVDAVAACPPADDFSLPSNHATIAAGLAAAVVAVRPRLAWVVVPLGVLVGAARVALGVHYPHDVTGGLALGGSVTALAVLALTRQPR